MQVKSKSALSAKSGQRKPRRQNNHNTFSRNKIIIFGEILILIGALVFYLSTKINVKSWISRGVSPQSKFAAILNKKVPTPSPSPIASPTPTPSPRPLTFDEMNARYGPCIRLPVLMYHHVQSKEAAVANKQTGLTVYTDVFMAQMDYLKSKGYRAIPISDLVNFFDTGTSIESKSIILTFDDGYNDNFTDAYPVLKNAGFKATIFLATGLMNNPGYLNWSSVSAMTDVIHFSNHTWSHKSVLTSSDVMQKEISLADIQLTEHGLNTPKIFAYPYGPDSVASEKYLNSLDYKLAFTTTPGNILCKKLRFNLPRIRVGNGSMSNYGF